MKDEEIEQFPAFDFDSYEDAVKYLQALEIEFVILGKRIRVAMDEMRESMTEKLWTRVKKLGHMIEDAFRVDSMEDYNQAAAIYGTELAGTLYQLSAGFSGLKIAIIQAAAPIVQLLVPVIRLAVDALTGLFRSIGTALQMLFQGGEASEDFSSGMYGAAAAGKALKRSLAGFDQINRLDRQTSSGGVSIPSISTEPLTGPWKEFAEKLAELMRPLQKIDLTPLSKSLERLKKALEPITRALFDALEWAWYNLFVPMAQWAVEELLPEFLDAVTAALKALGRVIEELKPTLLWLWENYLKPLAQWKADELIYNLQSFAQEMTGASGSIIGSQGVVDNFIDSAKILAQSLASISEEYLKNAQTELEFEKSIDSVMEHFLLALTPFGDTNTALGTLGNMLLQVAQNFGIMSNSSNSAWSSMKDIWGTAWSYLKEKLTDPAYAGFKSTANGIIGLVNGMIRGVTAGVNAVSGSMNKISFKVPDWVPFIGGNKFGFNIPQMEETQVPQLAKGAVLPANQPFLAVVGDQKHGTNVEAPLATIQEAVATVMDGYMGDNMAGHRATVEILQELLNAVLGIQIGDEAIAAAAARYDRKMAVVRGGFL